MHKIPQKYQWKSARAWRQIIPQNSSEVPTETCVCVWRQSKPQNSSEVLIKTYTSVEANKTTKLLGSTNENLHECEGKPNHKIRQKYQIKPTRVWRQTKPQSPQIPTNTYTSIKANQTTNSSEVPTKIYTGVKTIQTTKFLGSTYENLHDCKGEPNQNNAEQIVLNNIKLNWIILE